SPKAQSEALSTAERRSVVHASEAVGAGVSGLPVRVGDSACLRREPSGEPDVGNLHLRFDEGRVGRGLPSLSLLLYRLRLGLPYHPLCVAHPERFGKYGELPTRDNRFMGSTWTQTRGMNAASGAGVARIAVRVRWCYRQRSRGQEPTA